MQFNSGDKIATSWARQAGVYDLGVDRDFGWPDRILATYATLPANIASACVNINSSISLSLYKTIKGCFLHLFFIHFSKVFH